MKSERKVVKRMAKHKEAMARYYNRKVKVKRLNTGDLVLRKLSQATKDPSQGKLGPAWEGLYEVICHSKKGSYYLKSLDCHELPQPWNIKHLKKYYQKGIIYISSCLIFMSVCSTIITFVIHKLIIHESIIHAYLSMVIHELFKICVALRSYP